MSGMLISPWEIVSRCEGRERCTTKSKIRKQPEGTWKAERVEKFWRQ